MWEKYYFAKSEDSKAVIRRHEKDTDEEKCNQDEKERKVSGKYRKQHRCLERAMEPRISSRIVGNVLLSENVRIVKP